MRVMRITVLLFGLAACLAVYQMWHAVAILTILAVTLEVAFK